MNAYPKRRHADLFADEPRATYAQNSVTNRTVLVSPDGEQRATLRELGWSELMADDCCGVLMLPPEGFRFSGGEL